MACEWTYLGHAMWLARYGELRLLFDPLLESSHHGGVFVPAPARRVHLEALRPDFIVVSHRHPDHFDVASLARLAAADRETVVITADPLVQSTAQALGFAQVARVDPWHRIELDGVTLLTTPSRGPVAEWGVLAHSDDGTIYNQVDTVLRDVDDVRNMLRTAAAALELPSLADGPDLALVRWQPQLEIEASLAGAIGFPFDAYGELLAQTAALSAGALVPAASGERHAAAYQAMNQLVYPVPLERWLRDVRRVCPDSQLLAPLLGTGYRLHGGRVTATPASAELVEACGDPPNERFVPLAIAPLRDRNPDGHGESAMREVIDGWLRDDLAVALVRAGRRMAVDWPLRLVVEVVYANARDGHTFTLTDGSVHVERRLEDDYDVLNQVAASMLFDVIEGRRHWGEPLLAGQLRACERAYRIGGDGLERAEVAAIFLYYALSYERSQQRQVAWQLSQLQAGADR
jgi:hypothetical protein